MRKTSLVLALLALPAAAAAHPGHGFGGGSYSLLHYLTEPVHGLSGLLGIAAVGLLAVWVTGRR